MGRMSIMFSFSAFAGAFSGLLAAAVVNMDGVGGRPGWAWIFIIVCRSLPLQNPLHKDSLTTACALGRIVFDIVWAYGHGLPAELTFDSPDLDGEREKGGIACSPHGRHRGDGEGRDVLSLDRVEACSEATARHYFNNCRILQRYVLISELSDIQAEADA